MSRPRTSSPPAIAEDEIDEEMDEDEEDFEEGPDIFEALGSLLATEDGETLATTLVGLKDEVTKIALHMEMQNKILVKMLMEMKKTVDA